jgi:hypothetical protein
LETEPVSKTGEPWPCEFDSRPLRAWKRWQTGDCTRFEPGRATALGVRLAPLPLPGTAQLVEGTARPMAGPPAVNQLIGVRVSAPERPSSKSSPCGETLPVRELPLPLRKAAALVRVQAEAPCRVSHRGWEAVRKTAVAGSTPERGSTRGRCSRYGRTSTACRMRATRSASGPAGTSMTSKPRSR